MAQIFIGLGSNLGDRAGYLNRALLEMAKLEQTSIKKCSSVYETEPVGIKKQPHFLNMVAELDSNLPPGNLLRELKKIEHAVGRTRSSHWGAREIDIDILYYGGEVFHEADMQIPHPEIGNRRFVLVPMKEIAAKFHDPMRKLNVEELLSRCSDTGAVRKTSRHISIKVEE